MHSISARSPKFSHRWRLLLCAVLCVAGAADLVAREPRQSLAGRWRFALDRQDGGIHERWFEQRLPKQVRLPGSLPAQGIGDEITVDTPWIGSIIDRSYFTAPEFAKYREPGNIKVPFWLQPEKYYAGAAWYQRDIDIPKDWEGKRILLSLERPHWETRVWVDSQCVGTNLSLSTPHEHELGMLAQGRHRLTIRVDNRLVIDVGRDSHSVSDHTQGNWNGIVGRIELRATPPVWIEDLQVYPRADRKLAMIRGRIGNVTGQAGNGAVTIRVGEAQVNHAAGGAALAAPVRIPVGWQTHGGAFECEIHMPAAQLWDEFQPVSYLAEATLQSQPQSTDIKTVRFGFREFGVNGTQFTVNGRKIYLRGTLECCIFPKTGHPPVDVESWRRILRTIQAHGLNHMRFHSWCPPEAAFVAADELGVYLQVECSSWANASTTLGDGKPVDRWIYEEAGRILRFYGNHPSFVMLLYGNEPGGERHKSFLSQWVAHFRNADGRRLYSGGAGWPQLSEDQFHVTPEPRIQAWGAGLKSRINALPPETRTDYRQSIASHSVPVISHEIGQWCVYPNFEEIRKYTGYLKPRNFEIFKETLAAHHMTDQAPAFLLASGKLQALCYKEDIESALRTPGMAGFQLLDLHDFPGQGTALVGVLDPFWEEKGYIKPAAFRRFSGRTVPLARMDKRVFTQDETAAIGFEVAHFGPGPLEKVWPVFKIVGDDGKAHLSGHFGIQTLETGALHDLAVVRPAFQNLPAPARYKLVLALARTPEGKGLLCENDWDLWVYPSKVQTPAPAAVSIVEDLNEDALAKLRAGEKVLWLLPPGRVAPDPTLGRIALGFSSIFWNTAWTGRQAPHTLGILCNPKHPLFASFPTDAHSNWQWWHLVHRAGAMILDELPPKLRPSVQVIDDWVTARRLGLVFEAKVGKGRLVVCSIDLTGELEDNPVARQFRHSLLAYMGSAQFQPHIEVRPESLRRLKQP